MDNQFSLDVQQVVAHMENVAFKLHHNVVGSEHLLLGVLSFENVFSIEMKRCKVTYDQIYKKINEKNSFDENIVLHMEYTNELMNIFSRAKTLSLKYKEKNVSIYSLCLALINFSDCVGVGLLKKWRIDFKELNNYLISFIKKDSDLLNIADLHLMNRDKDPLIGREDELNQLVMVLSRRNKPKAILIGEPGVGKSAIVEELARLLNENKIPSLKNKTIFELDLPSVVGGTKYRGEFEEKIKKILKKVIEDGNAILFIDEIHNIIKAGGAEGAIDAANILKPYLSRSEIQIIGATTIGEFQSIFEKDAALKRRFQIINVRQNTSSETIDILKKNKSFYENFYKIKIDDNLLDYIVDLSEQYLPNYCFPDKAIDLLDNACVLAKGVLDRASIDKTLELFYKIKVNQETSLIKVMNRIKNNLALSDNVLDQLKRNLKTIDLSIRDKNKVMLSMLFLGPFGVGKNTVADIIGEEYFSLEDIFHLNLSSYQDIYSLQRLMTSVNDEQSNFIKFVKTHPSSLIVLKEIEKANNEVLDFFFDIIDKGYFETLKGEKLSCKSMIIIMTSNYGFADSIIFNDEHFNDIDNNYIVKKLKSRFKIEYLSKLDDIVIFGYLNSKDRAFVAQKYLEVLGEDPSKHDICNILIHSEDDYNKFGVRLIQKDVKTAILNNLMKN